MIKLAIVFPSHRPNLVMRQYQSRHNISEIDFEFCIVGQDPVTIELLSSMEKTRYKIVSKPKIPGLIEMVHWYDVGFKLAPDAEYFLIVDDDHHYRPGSGKYISECISYMDSNHDVGFLMTKGTFGSFAWGDKIVKNPTNGLINLDRGMIMRSYKDFRFTDEELGFVGTLVESLLGYKIIEDGWKISKRFLNPTAKDRGKRIDSGGITYATTTLENNILGYIRRKYKDPKWTHESRRYPFGLNAMHVKSSAERFRK